MAFILRNQIKSDAINELTKYHKPVDFMLSSFRGRFSGVIFSLSAAVSEVSAGSLLDTLASRGFWSTGDVEDLTASVLEDEDVTAERR